MDREQQIANLQELNDLLCESNHWRTIRDCAALFKNAGLLTTYDTARPQAWWDDFYKKTGQPPDGIVWGYDSASIFGRPFALTARAQSLLAIYEGRR